MKKLRYFYNPNKKMCQKAKYIYNNCIDIEHLLKTYKQTKAKGSLKAFHDTLESQGIYCSRQWLCDALKSLKLYKPVKVEDKALKYFIKTPGSSQKDNKTISEILNVSCRAIEFARERYCVFLRSGCQTYEEFKSKRSGNGMSNSKKIERNAQTAKLYLQKEVEKQKAIIEKNSKVFPIPSEVILAKGFLKKVKKMINLHLAIQEKDAQLLKFNDNSSIIKFLETLKNHDCIWLICDDNNDGEIIITENLHTVLEAISMNQFGAFFGEQNFYIQQYTNYEDAYKVALNIREVNPKCYS